MALLQSAKLVKSKSIVGSFLAILELEKLHTTEFLEEVNNVCYDQQLNVFKGFVSLLMMICGVGFRDFLVDICGLHRYLRKP